LFINHPAIPRGNPDFYVYEVIEALMFRGPSSRLYRRMVVDERSAIKVQGGYEANRGPSLFSLFAVLAQGGDPSALAAVYREELDRLAREPLAPDELERVHNRLRSARAFGRQDLIHQANSLGRSVLYHSDIRWEETYLERILRVEPQDIVRVARRDFDPNSMVALEVRPV
jgi:zinc protease